MRPHSEARLKLFAAVALVILCLPAAYYAFVADFTAVMTELRNRATEEGESSSERFAAFAPERLSETEIEAVARRMIAAELDRTPMHWLCMSYVANPDALVEQAMLETESLHEELILRLGSWRKTTYADELAGECAALAGSIAPEEQSLFDDFGPRLWRDNDAIADRLRDLWCAGGNDDIMDALAEGRSARGALLHCRARSCLVASDGTTLRVSSLCSPRSAVIQYLQEGARIPNDSEAVRGFWGADAHEILASNGDRLPSVEATGCEAAARVATTQPVACEVAFPAPQGSRSPFQESVCVGEHRVGTASARYFDGDAWHDFEGPGVSHDMLGHFLFQLRTQHWEGEVEIADLERLLVEGEAPAHIHLRGENESDGVVSIRAEGPPAWVLHASVEGVFIQRLQITLSPFGRCPTLDR